MTVEEAVQTIKAGARVRMTVGEGSEDPVLIIWNDDGCVMSESVAGWSAGVVEPVCGIESNFLLSYLAGKLALDKILLKAGEAIVAVWEKPEGGLLVRVRGEGGEWPLDVYPGEDVPVDVAAFVEANGYGWKAVAT